jgi:hypothetical protein
MAGSAAWWEGIAEGLAEEGLLAARRGQDEPPKRPTGKIARQTWWRVSRDRQRWAQGWRPVPGRPRKKLTADIKVAPVPSPALPSPIASTLRSQQETAAELEEKPLRRFGVTRPRK